MKNLNKSFVSLAKIKAILRRSIASNRLRKNNSSSSQNGVVILDEHELAMTI